MSAEHDVPEARDLVGLIRLAAMDGYNKSPVSTVDEWVEEGKKRVLLVYLAGRASASSVDHEIVDIAARFKEAEEIDPEDRDYDYLDVSVFKIDDGEQHWYVARSMDEALKTHIAFVEPEDDEITISVIPANEEITRTDSDGEAIDDTTAMAALPRFFTIDRTSHDYPKTTATAWAWATYYRNEAPTQFMATVF